MLKKIIPSFCLLLLSFCFVVFGVACSGPDLSNSKKVTFGQESSNSQKIEIINNTGKEIISVSVKNSDKDNFEKLDIFPADSKWDIDKLADIFITKSSNNSSASTEAGNISIRSICDISVVFNDGTSSVVHNLTVDTIDMLEDINLCWLDTENILFLEYKENGNQVSTLAAEQKILNDKKLSEEAARQQSEALKNNENNQYNNSIKSKNTNSDSNYNSSNQNSGSSSKQYSEGCTGENIAIR